MQNPLLAAPQTTDFARAAAPAALAQMADALPWPMLVLQPDAFLVVANRAARRLLREGRILALIDGRRLQLSQPALQERLLQLLAASAARGTRSLLQLPGPGAGYSATITPLGSGEPQAPRRVLLALAGDDSRRSDTRSYAQLHALSPAETRVLLRLVNGDNSSRAADALGVDPSTVRSQILSLRRKTGHASVAELLRAVSRMPPIGLDSDFASAGGE